MVHWNDHEQFFQQILQEISYLLVLFVMLTLWEESDRRSETQAFAKLG
jgi:hypothetical protein